MENSIGCAGPCFLKSSALLWFTQDFNVYLKGLKSIFFFYFFFLLLQPSVYICILSVWEPPPPPYSSHSLPPNPYDNPQLDSPRGYASLPIQLNPSSLEPQPGAPVAPSRSSVQTQESSDPSTRPRAPYPIAIAQGPALPYAVAQPDEVDTRTSADGISKTPVPETSPSPLFPESNGVLSEVSPFQVLFAIKSKALTSFRFGVENRVEKS